MLTAGSVLPSAARLASAQGARSNDLKLESERWTLELTEHGAVRRLTHKPSGTVLLEAGPHTPAYELASSGRLEGPGANLSGFVTLTATKSGRLESNLAAKVHSEPLSTPRGKGYRFTCKHEEKTVVWEVVLAREHGGIEFRIRVRHSGKEPVGAIRFPCLIAPPKLGATGADNVAVEVDPPLL